MSVFEFAVDFFCVPALSCCRFPGKKMTNDWSLMTQKNASSFSYTRTIKYTHAVGIDIYRRIIDILTLRDTRVAFSLTYASLSAH